MVEAGMHSIERIYPPDLDPDNPAGRLLIVGTANDAGRLSDKARAIGKKFWGAKTEYLPGIRRQELVAA